MLLHKFNINMTIAVILSKISKLYDFPGLQYQYQEYPSELKTIKNGRGQKRQYATEFKIST